jgi:hypothetical protein
MTVSNKELYSLFKSIKNSDSFINGLYIEGFNGGVTVYATDGRVIYRKFFYGDNKEVFTAYYKDWNKKDGVTSIDGLKLGEKDERNMVQKMKDYFEAERFNSLSVNYNEFKKAVNGVDAIYRGESVYVRKNRGIILSIHNGKFDIAAWTQYNGIKYKGVNCDKTGDSASWQLDGDYSGNGAVCIAKKYLDSIKGKTLEFSYSELQGKIVLNVHGDIEAVIMPKQVDPAEFMEVLEYEYKMPEKAIELELVIEKPELKLVVSEAKQARKPVKRIMRNKYKNTSIDNPIKIIHSTRKNTSRKTYVYEAY